MGTICQVRCQQLWPNDNGYKHLCFKRILQIPLKSRTLRYVFLLQRNFAGEAGERTQQHDDKLGDSIEKPLSYLKRRARTRVELKRLTT